MQVAVIAARHAVCSEQLQNLRAGVPAVARRIVQEAVFFRVPRQLQRAFEPPKLPPENFLVVAALLLRVVEPPARAAQGDIAVEEAGIIQDVKVCKPVLRAEAVKGPQRRPPVVMVALEDDLAAGDGVHKGKILRRVVKAHRPAEIAEQDGRVLRANDLQIFPQLFHIPCPAAPEHVHRLVCRAERQVQISNRVQGHQRRNSVTTARISPLSVT